jgi:hypothetical protein
VPGSRGVACAGDALQIFVHACNISRTDRPTNQQEFPGCAETLADPGSPSLDFRKIAYYSKGSQEGKLTLKNKLTTIPEVYETRDLIRLLGIDANFLNKLIERRLYGVKPSLKTGQGPGSRRWFSREDVLGVALVWWLFQAGLRAGLGKIRTSVVQGVIDQISGPGSTAKEAARSAEISEMLMIIREPSARGLKSKRASQQVTLVNSEDEATAILRKNTYAFILVIPIGNLYLDLKNEMAELRPSEA